VGIGRRQAPSATTAVRTSNGLNDGTYTGSPTLGATGALSGDSDTAATFNGTDQYVTISSAPSIVGTAFSVEAWFKSSNSGSTPQVVYAEGISGGGNPLLALFGSSSTDMTFRLRDDANVEYNVTDTTGDWNDGSWHHWVAVRDGSTLTLFKDGSQVDQVTSVSTGTFSLDTSTIAALDRNGIESFGDGTIDEVAIYDTALTSTQVLDHYNSGAGVSAGTLTTLHAASPLDASDNTYLTFTANVTEILSRAMDNIADGDFVTMDTLSIDVEYSLTGPGDDDVQQLLVRIMNGTTVLAAADSGGTFKELVANVTNTTDTNTGAIAFDYVNTTASKTTWDGASVEIEQIYTKNKGNDNVAIRVDHVIISGTYTPLIPATVILIT